MKLDKLVWVAILVTVPLLVLQLMLGVKLTAGDRGIPLLTLLVMNEFGILLCAISVGVSVNVMKKSGVRPVLLAGTLALSVLALVFMWRLLLLYPTG